MLVEKGYRNWLTNFLNAMTYEDWTYWMRLGAVPKYEVMYVYLCIGNRIRYRANFVMYHGPGEFTFTDGKRLYGRAWVVLCGPVARAPRDIPMRGFRGFRYSDIIF